MELPVTLEYDGTLAYQANALADKWNTSRTAKNLSDLFNPSDLQNLDAKQIGEHSLLGYVGLTQIPYFCTRQPFSCKPCKPSQLYQGPISVFLEMYMDSPIPQILASVFVSMK